MSGRWIGVLALALLASGSATADIRRSSNARPADSGNVRIYTPGGPTWKQIRLRHMDARYSAMILGGVVLPTEMDVLRMRGGFGGGMVPMGGGMGGFGSGYGGVGGQGIIGDLNSNSLLMGPGRPGAFGAFGNRLPIIADPNSNSLLVDP